jgi:hypothetical protein
LQQYVVSLRLAAFPQCQILIDLSQALRKDEAQAKKSASLYIASNTTALYVVDHKKLFYLFNYMF